MESPLVLADVGVAEEPIHVGRTRQSLSRVDGRDLGVEHHTRRHGQGQQRAVASGPAALGRRSSQEAA